MVFDASSSRPPSPLLAWTELPRALIELGSLGWAAPMLMSAPRGDGHPVLVLPGFVTTDASTAILRGYLESLGYSTHAWELGRNLGPRAIGMRGEKLLERLETIHLATGRKVSLVGWSLGGLMARQLARQRPDVVSNVITLGSPFTGDPRATNVRHAYEALTGQRIDDEDTRAQLREISEPLPVPSTAVFTRSDGVVSWRNCREDAGRSCEAIEVYGSHCGLGVNPAVYWIIADRLAQAGDGWMPFERKGWGTFLYPHAGTRVH